MNPNTTQHNIQIFISKRGFIFAFCYFFPSTSRLCSSLFLFHRLSQFQFIVGVLAHSENIRFTHTHTQRSARLNIYKRADATVSVDETVQLQCIGVLFFFSWSSSQLVGVQLKDLSLHMGIGYSIRLSIRCFT